MKKITLVLVILVGLLGNISAQKLHTPAEILKIMEKSEISYQIEMFKNPISAPNRDMILNYHVNYLAKTENGTMLMKYTPKEEAKEYIDKAEALFGQRKFQEAQKMYFKVLEIAPSYYKVMTYIGQIYGIEKNFDKAIEWYKKTIETNYIDYMAHWFLADIYKSQGRMDEATREITIAHVLNRNNPRIKQSLKAIYEENKLLAPEWVFNPQIKVDSVGANKITIAANEDWLGYAMAEAVWTYEPDYATSLNNNFTLQKKEGIIALATVLDKKKFKKVPVFKALKRATDKKMLEEYIIFETILPEYPWAALQLPQDFIEKMADYVMEIRGKKK